MTLRADVRLTLGALRLDARLEVADGEVVAVLGPNGAGKTTLLRALARLLPLTSGGVELGGRALEDPAKGHPRPARAAVGRRGLPGPPAVPASQRGRQRRVRAARAA